MLGEHVGGSAVKSICCASEVHIVHSIRENIDEETIKEKSNVENKENPSLLISVGAKRILTSWLLRNRNREKVDKTGLGQFHDGVVNGCKNSGVPSPSLSFQWLSTDMPTRNSSIHGKMKDIEKRVDGSDRAASLNINSEAELKNQESLETETKAHLESKFEDDWRYLAVTAFLVKLSGSR